MFFIRYNWTLPFRAQIAISVAIAVLGALVWAPGSSARAHDFVELHHNRCMQQHGPLALKACATRTIQLASNLHGEAFGNQVAEALH